ncbi:ParB/RepB/Spo0J family partition protein [Agathobaculum butyriciproducens]
MSRKKDIDLDLTGFAELFMNDEGRAESRLPRIYDIPLSEIDDFPNHPFKVKMDEDMNQLVQSVKERGIITPITLRQKEDGRYEIVSGHRRRKACELAGLESVPAEIKELSRDEAIILMVESNLQRSIILPSEKAFSYKMRLEAMKRQAGRPQENCSPVDNNLKGIKTASLFKEQTGDGQAQVYRYIRLTELIPELLDMVDENKIAFRPAVELSYLTETEQHNLLNSISYNDATPSLPQAIRLKKFSKDGKLSAEVIEAILGEEKPNQHEKISFKAERLRPYIPSTVPLEKTEDYIIKALEYYQRARERQKREQAR